MLFGHGARVFIFVHRRAGGLEINAFDILAHREVHRRAGGLEINIEGYAAVFNSSPPCRRLRKVFLLCLTMAGSSPPCRRLRKYSFNLRHPQSQFTAVQAA